MKFDVRMDWSAVKRKLDELPVQIRDRAAASAMNKTIDQARTQMARRITQEFAVSSSYVKERLRVRGASTKGGALQIEARLIGGDGRRRSANIIAFVEKKTTLAQARKRAKDGTLQQLYVRVRKGGGSKPLAGAFIANKGRTVFEREGKARLPIRPVQVIDVPQMFNTKRINADVVAFVKAKFPDVFNREAAYFLQRNSAPR